MDGRDIRALKPLIPAIDMGRSGRFYLDLGFACRWSNRDMAEYAFGATAFLLHRDYMAVVAQNTVMCLLVSDVQAWWSHVHARRLNDVHGIRYSAVSWDDHGRGEFTIHDPAGVRWRIVQPGPEASA